MNFPQALCTASMVRSGAITKEVAANFLDVSAEVMEDGINDLERRQKAVKKMNRWRHENQNAIDKGQGRLPSRIIVEDWDWLLENNHLKGGSSRVPLTESQRSELSEIKAGCVQVGQSKAKRLVELVGAWGNGSKDEKEEGSVQLDYGSLRPDDRGALACLDAILRLFRPVLGLPQVLFSILMGFGWQNRANIETISSHLGPSQVMFSIFDGFWLAKPSKY